jgi:TRAP-type C4-dicarboxylate transport system substrate-binding protein
MEAIIEEVKVQTNGNFSINIFYSGQLSDPRENLMVSS